MPPPLVPFTSFFHSHTPPSSHKDEQGKERIAFPLISKSNPSNECAGACVLLRMVGQCNHGSHIHAYREHTHMHEHIVHTHTTCTHRLHLSHLSSAKLRLEPSPWWISLLTLTLNCPTPIAPQFNQSCSPGSALCVTVMLVTGAERMKFEQYTCECSSEMYVQFRLFFSE